MKKILVIFVLGAFVANNQSAAQNTGAKKEIHSSPNAEASKEDKSERLSPPAIVTETTPSGNKITVDYSSPAVNRRSIGRDIAPYGEVWRTGANEATVIEITKDATINGHDLPAGKYSLYSIPGEKIWTLIFNKLWNQWGTEYDATKDALRVQVEAFQGLEFSEKLTFNINKEGRTTIMWGNTVVDFLIN